MWAVVCTTLEAKSGGSAADSGNRTLIFCDLVDHGPTRRRCTWYSNFRPQQRAQQCPARDDGLDQYIAIFDLPRVRKYRVAITKRQEVHPSTFATCGTHTGQVFRIRLLRNILQTHRKTRLFHSERNFLKDYPTCEGNQHVFNKCWLSRNGDVLIHTNWLNENWRLYCTDFLPYYRNGTHSGILTINLYHAQPSLDSSKISFTSSVKNV